MVIVIRCVHAALWLIAAYKWGDWKNWFKYYPTMLFMGMGSLIYLIVFRDKMLWILNPGPLNPIFTEIFLTFTIFSCSVLIYLTHFPKGLVKQALYVTLWVAIYIIIEIIMLNLGLERFANGWNIWWSVIHDYYQFPLLAIHHRRPYLAWSLAIITLVIMMKIFGIPITNS